MLRRGMVGKVGWREGREREKRGDAIGKEWREGVWGGRGREGISCFGGAFRFNCVDMLNE